MHVAAKLNIIDLLHEGPKTPRELAESTGAHEPSLRRLLGFLTTVDVLNADGEGRFVATEMGELLRSDHPESERPWAILLGSPIIWRPWGDLYESILTGQPAFDRVFEEPFFQYLGRNPDDSEAFNAAMTSSSSDVPTILDAYDFSGLSRIVDIGGGQGALLQGILERHPQASGVLYDLPTVVADSQWISDSTVSSRCEVVGGDMFQSVPAGGDAYILKRIVHDWSDAEAIQILQNCRQAMNEQGRVLLVERIAQPASQGNPATSSDLMMLVLVSGRERTEEEFRELYAEAGLKLTRVISAGGRSIIEGIRVIKVAH